VTNLSPAERLLQELGVTDPREIDLDAIAWYLGAQIKYCDLDGCEARIVGHGNQAIITVQTNVSPGRKRFSIGHELGHWRHHRGRILICRPEDIGPERQRKPATEKTADQYAADLLLPGYLFRPEVQKHKRLTWEAVRELADVFSASITATAIRIIDLNLFPALLVCHGARGRRWFVRARDVPQRWFPQDQLISDSFAFDVLYGKCGEHPPRLMDADTWFDRRDASRYQLYEQSIKVTQDEVLTLLVPKDDEMLEEADSGSFWRRR
jgi:hypothetical protein